MLEPDDIELFRPDRELRRLAAKAKDLGLEEHFLRMTSADALFEAIKECASGDSWLADWHRTADPWFRVRTDPGHPGVSHVYGTWMDRPEIPLDMIKGYIAALAAGRSLDTNRGKLLKKRDYETEVFQHAIPMEDRNTFAHLLSLSRKATCFIEEHTLYVEHWASSVFWSKSKDLASSLSGMGALDSPEDMFFLRKEEVAQCISDTVARWSVGDERRCNEHWRDIVRARQRMRKALSSRAPIPFLGTYPDEWHPALESRWGITDKTIGSPMARSHSVPEGVLSGIGVSAGIVRGRVRLVGDRIDPTSINSEVVVVCGSPPAAWTHVFVRAGALLCDSGGLLSHAAVVCREYGLPAVMGLRDATQVLRDGQTVYVDGQAGTVTVID